MKTTKDQRYWRPVSRKLPTLRSVRSKVWMPVSCSSVTVVVPQLYLG